MFPFTHRPEDRLWFAVLAGVALVLAVVQAVVSYGVAGGHFMLPLDDAYIHLQYARRIVEGAPLVYTPGAGASGGMTSPLFVALLTPGQLPGLGGGVRGALFSYALGAAMWMLLPIWVYQLAMRLAGRLGGALAAALVLANGHLMWCFLAGMETGLFTLLVVGWCLAMAEWWGEGPGGAPRHAPAMAWTCLALLPLARPEGAVLLLPAAVLAWWGAPGARSSRAARLATVAGAALPFCAWLGVLAMTTGEWRPAGLVVKGLGAFPYFDLSGRFLHASETLAAITTRFYANRIPDPAYAAFKGFGTMPYMAPGLALLAAFGASLLMLRDIAARRPGPGTALAAAWLLGTASLAASLLPFIHQQRYLAPWTPLMIVLAVVALHRGALHLRRHRHPALAAAATALILLSAPSVPWWMAEHGRNARDIYHVLRVATFPLQAEHAGHYALTDAGVLAYYTDHRFDDFVGLVSAPYAAATLHGEGATLEVLAAASPRPTHLISYREWFSPRFPVGEGDVLSAVPRTSITSGLVIRRMPILDTMLDPAPLAHPDGTDAPVLLDVQVANLASEAAAGYRFAVGIYDARPDAWPQPLAPVEHFLRPDGSVVADGGRVVRREQFRLTPPPGFDPVKTGATLLARVAAPRHPGAPGGNATALRVTVRSTTTGATATRILPLPTTDPEAPLPHAAALPLGDALDEAGGFAWDITIESDSPPNAPWGSYHHTVRAGE